MTNNDDDGVRAEVDASKIYSQGQAFQVIVKRYNLLEIDLKNAGTIPVELQGSFTNVPRALQAINSYISKRIAYFEFQERRQKAKKGLKRLKKKEEPNEE